MDKNDLYQKLMNEISQWSDAQFSKGNFERERSIPISFHLMEEAKELNLALQEYFGYQTVENFEKVEEELADCLMLLLDCSCHFGYNTDELRVACHNKLEVNKHKRRWGEPDINGVVHHLKEHKLHTHYMYEERLGLPGNKRIIDAEFKPLCNHYLNIEEDPGHIIVTIDELKRIKVLEDLNHD